MKFVLLSYRGVVPLRISCHHFVTFRDYIFYVHMQILPLFIMTIAASGPTLGPDGSSWSRNDDMQRQVLVKHIGKGDVIISEESEKWYSRLVVTSIAVPIDSGFSVYIAASRREGDV